MLLFLLENVGDIVTSGPLAVLQQVLITAAEVLPDQLQLQTTVFIGALNTICIAFSRPRCVQSSHVIRNVSVGRFNSHQLWVIFHTFNQT